MIPFVGKDTKHYLGSQRPAELGKRAAHIGGSTVFIIRQRIDNQCDTSWSVPFVGEL